MEQDHSQPETNTSFQPCDVLVSPLRQQKQGNLTGSPRVVQDSSTNLYNSIQEWNREHLIGAGILSEICNNKIIHINKQLPMDNEQWNEEVNPDMKELCHKFEKICDNLENVVENLKEVTSQYEAVMKLNEMKNHATPFFTTRKIQNLVLLSKKVAGMYEQELKLKIFIKENISHAKCEKQILLYETIWIHQPYIDNLDLQIDEMLKETVFCQQKIK